MTASETTTSRRGTRTPPKSTMPAERKAGKEKPSPPRRRQRLSVSRDGPEGEGDHHAEADGQKARQRRDGRRRRREQRQPPRRRGQKATGATKSADQKAATAAQSDARRRHWARSPQDRRLRTASKSTGQRRPRHRGREDPSPRAEGGPRRRSPQAREQERPPHRSPPHQKAKATAALKSAGQKAKAPRAEARRPASKGGGPRRSPQGRRSRTRCPLSRSRRQGKKAATGQKATGLRSTRRSTHAGICR